MLEFETDDPNLPTCGYVTDFNYISSLFRLNIDYS